MNTIFSKNRKGFSSLETILSLILSVIALVFLFNVFSTVFLNSPENLEITEQNVKSFGEFIDFSENKYENFNSCYSFLKIKNFENFQLDQDKKKYFYVINSEGIYYLEIEKYESFFKNPVIENFKSKPDYEFKESYNLLKDETEEGNIFVSALTAEFMGQASNIINLGVKYESIVLTPNYDSNQNDFKIDIFKDGKDISCGQTSSGGHARRNNVKYDQDCLDKISYIIFDPINNNIILTQKENSITLFKQNSCYGKLYSDELQKKLEDNNFEDLDYENKNLEFGYKFNGELVKDLRFKWKGKPICIKDSKNQGNFDEISNIVECKTILSNVDDLTSYENFIQSIQDYYKKDTGLGSGVGRLFLINSEIKK
jgi:hypothetical protein